VVFVGLFLVSRYFLIPESFGKYGHYRANSLDEIEALPVHYAGKAACIECHPTETEQLESDLHYDLSCEVCHGPGAQHANDPDHYQTLKKPGTREFCGQCHDLHPARNAEFVNQVDIMEHRLERNNCIDCHNPHAVWELKK
jgi:hypothetical protein